MTEAGMSLNAKKTKVIVNGKEARRLVVKRSWVDRSLPAHELHYCAGPRSGRAVGSPAKSSATH
eukprot:674935-Amphidinium_carterae.2